MSASGNLWGAIKELEAEAVMAVQRQIDADFRATETAAAAERERKYLRGVLDQFNDRLSALEVAAARSPWQRLFDWLAGLKWGYRGGSRLW